MKKLALLLLASSRAICNPAPPAQPPEAEVHEPGAALAASAAAKTDADIGGPNGEAPPPPPPPAPPAEAFQPVAATLGGASWELKGAGTAGQVKGDGTVVVTLANYNVDCGPHTPGPGDKVIAVTIPWEKGAKVDLAGLKGKAIAATQFDEKRKKPEPLRDFRPTGTIEVLSAPTKSNTSGRIRIDLSNKLDVVRGEIPVKFCG